MAIISACRRCSHTYARVLSPGGTPPNPSMRLATWETNAASRVNVASIAGDGHAVDQNRAALTRPAHEHVIADRSDAFEHVAQVARDGDLLHRVGNFSAFDPKARRAS